MPVTLSMPMPPGTLNHVIPIQYQDVVLLIGRDVNQNIYCSVQWFALNQSSPHRDESRCGAAIASNATPSSSPTQTDSQTDSQTDWVRLPTKQHGIDEGGSRSARPQNQEDVWHQDSLEFSRTFFLH